MAPQPLAVQGSWPVPASRGLSQPRETDGCPPERASPWQEDASGRNLWRGWWFGIGASAKTKQVCKDRKFQRAGEKLKLNVCLTGPESGYWLLLSKAEAGWASLSVRAPTLLPRRAISGDAALAGMGDDVLTVLGLISGGDCEVARALPRGCLGNRRPEVRPSSRG